MKKRNLALLGTAAMLSLALAGTFGTVTASAKTISDTDPSPQTVPVTYNVADTWTVTVPESITIDGGTWTGSGTVSASDVRIEKNTKLTVKVESENEWKLKDKTHTGNEIAYELKANGEAFTSKDGNEVLAVEAGNASGSQVLTATVKEEEQKYSTGGEAYEDQLTFTVEVTDPE